VRGQQTNNRGRQALKLMWRRRAQLSEHLLRFSTQTSWRRAASGPGGAQALLDKKKKKKKKKRKKAHLHSHHFNLQATTVGGKLRREQAYDGNNLLKRFR